MRCVSELPPIRVGHEGAGNSPLCVAADDTCLTVLNPNNKRGLRKAALSAMEMARHAPTGHKPSKRKMELLESLVCMLPTDRFCDIIEDIYIEFTSNAFTKTVFSTLCFHLYAEGIVLFPRNFVRGGETIFTSTYKYQPTLNSNVKALTEFVTQAKHSVRLTSANNQELIGRWAFRLLLTVGPFQDNIRITENIARFVIEYAPTEPRKFWAFREAIHAINKISGAEAYAGNIDAILRPLTKAEDAHSGSPLDGAATRTSRADRTFAWSVLKDSTVELWRKLLADWIGSLKGRKRLLGNIVVGNHLLDYLIANPDVTRNPVEYLSIGYPRSRDFLRIISSKGAVSTSEQVARTMAFFEYVLNTLCSEGEEGHVYRMPGFANPIKEADIPMPPNYQPGQTHRLAMPIAWLAILQDILTREDFRWPKETFRKVDWLRTIDSETGKTTLVWNPVRTYLVLLKLLFPLRTHQARMLDSGEGDREVLDAKTRLWVANPRSVNELNDKQGVLRRIWDIERGSWFTGIYLNTNKTQDRVSGEIDRGYVVPWENQQVIKLALDLRDWQIRFNPLSEPTPYAHVQDAREASSDVVSRTPARYYLFRDATSENRAAPVSSGRLRSFWLTLCAELESELLRRGIRNQDDSPIQIIDSWREERGTRVPATAIFDLHSLRTTGLTAFAKAGVPIAVLSKLVAGHASFLMTLFYTRLDIGYVSDLLTDAQVKLNDNAQAEMASFIKALSISELSLRTAFNSRDGLETARKTQPAIWQWMDHGICPNGRTRCHEGGEPIVDQKDRKYHGPVRGGTGNCALCRFFITGHQFLTGLVAKLNETSFEAAERAKIWRLRNQQEQRLRAARLAAEDAGEVISPASDAEVRRAASATEDALAELDVIADTMHAYHNLISQATAIARRELDREGAETNTARPALIVNAPEDNQIDISYVEVPEFELVDEICRTARFYRSINWITANLRRKEIFNRMLMRNGIEPIYIGLPDEMSKIALDAASDLLRRRLPRAKVHELMSGEARLMELGLLDETTALIEQQIGRPVQRAVQVEQATGSTPGAIAQSLKLPSRSRVVSRGMV